MLATSHRRKVTKLISAKICGSFVVFLLAAAFNVVLGQECEPGSIKCPAGSTGSGGCYKPGEGICWDGLICPVPLSACRKGAKGRGGCYDLTNFRCSNGRIEPNQPEP